VEVQRCRCAEVVKNMWCRVVKGWCRGGVEVQAQRRLKGGATKVMQRCRG